MTTPARTGPACAKLQPWEHLKDPALFPLARDLLDKYKSAHPADPDLQRANKEPSCVSFEYECRRAVSYNSCARSSQCPRGVPSRRALAWFAMLTISNLNSQDEFFAYVCRKIRSAEWGQRLDGSTHHKLEALAASLMKVKPLDYSGKYNPAYRWKAVNGAVEVLGQGERNMAEWVFVDAFPAFTPPPKADRRRRSSAQSATATPNPHADQEWERHTTETGRAYYTNKRTKQSVWELPAAAPTATTAPAAATTAPTGAAPANEEPATGSKRAAGPGEDEWRKLRKVVRMIYDKVEAMKPPGIL